MLEDTAHWRQVNIAYPGDRAQRERHAVRHLPRILPAAEKDGIITAWWFTRKSRWRIRYHLTEDAGMTDPDPVHRLLSAETAFAWTRDIYEPEIHAFGGPESTALGHALFHHDSRHILPFLQDNPADRLEYSIVLCTAFMRAAGLDWNEQGDVWARITEQRAGLIDHAAAPEPATWKSFTAGIRHLLLGSARPEAVGRDWLTAFSDAGAELLVLREQGKLTRGIRAVIALHVIFHWNRIGIPGSTQAVLARAAKDAVFLNYPGTPE